MKYGRLAARRPIGLRNLPHYLHGSLSQAPAAVPPPAITDWGMLANDRLGDCTIAGAVHLRMANAAEHAQTETWPTEQQVIDTYLHLSGGEDTGLVEADVLGTWANVGLFGDKIGGFAPVNHYDQDELRSVIATFGAAYLGVAMPTPAQGQFAAGQPWDITGTSADRDIEDGHCVPAVGYDETYVYVVTWGRTQPVTWQWLAAYLEESWALISSEDALVNLTALQADLGLLASK